MGGRGSVLAFLGLAIAMAGCSGGGGGGSSGGGAAAAAGAGSGALAPTKQKAAVVVARAGEGFLEINQGKLFAHVKGTPRQMGEQYGELLGGHIEQVLVTIPQFIQSQNFPSWLFPGASGLTSALFWNYFPPEVIDYIQGVVAGMRKRDPSTFVTDDDLVFLTSVIDLGGILNGLITCSSVAVWGDLTQDRKMFQTRVVDLFTGSGLEDHAVVVVEKRDGKTPWANAGWTGLMGGASGLSAHGIGIGQIWAFSDDRAFGTPWCLTTRRIMEDGVSSEDGVRFFQNEAHRTYGSNFVFGDRGDSRGGLPQAWAVESSAHYTAAFRDNDPLEDLAVWNGPNGPEPYAIKVPFAVFRGDVCLDPGMRSRQTAANGPTGDPRTAGSYKNRYKGQSDRVLAYQAAGVKIGVQELIDLTKGVTMRGSSLQCCVYANSDLELWVADARRTPGRNYDAWEEPYVHYDFDYYLPTVDVSLDKANYVASETQRITIETRTMGSDRDLWLSLSIEGPGGTVLSYPQHQAPLALAFRRGSGAVTTVALDLPAAIPAGDYSLVARLTERGTSDLVDLSIASFKVQ